MPKKAIIQMNNTCETNNGGKLRRVAIVGTGSYAPEKILTNDDIAKIVDTSDEWIKTRTGVKEKRR